MPDRQEPQPKPDRDPAPRPAGEVPPRATPSGAQPATPAPPGAQPARPASSGAQAAKPAPSGGQPARPAPAGARPAQPAGAQQGAQPSPAPVRPPIAGGSRPALPPRAASESPARARKPHVPGRAVIAAAVAILVVAAGVIASLLGARSIAHNHAVSSEQGFKHNAAEISSTLKLAVEHEEDAISSAATFFAANPKATPAEFSAWTASMRTLDSHPALTALGFVTIVPAGELQDFSARVGESAQQSAGSGEGGALSVVPPGSRPYYCLTAAGLSRSAGELPPVGLDYCARTAGLLGLRDSAHSSYALVSAGHAPALATYTPVYRGATTPHSRVGRNAAFVGWLREVMLPGVVMQQALRGHPGNGLRLRYRTGSSDTIFTSGPQGASSPSVPAGLHGGAAARVYGPVVQAGVLHDSEALLLLIAGTVVSVLLGLIVFLLGSGLGRAAGGAGERPASRRPPETPGESLYDPLTGLPNRALTLDLAERMVARAGRQSGMLAGALCIDVDWFKHFNEKLGMEAGDQLLRIVAQRLEAVIRAGDTVGRLGGDRFVVLVESEARAVRLDSLARRVIEALHEPVELEDFGPSFVLTASIGVAFGRYASRDELLRDSHLAMQTAKEAGRDRYTLFNANMRSVIEDRGVLEAELNTALHENQLFLLYQPIYDLTSRQVVSFEALVRWRHPKRGVLAAAEFIPIAEDSGLVVPIGRWVLEEACSRAAAWNVDGHRVGISAMVSATQLNRDGLATDIRRALQQSGLDPALLTLEIAESTVMLDIGASTERMEELKHLGVRIAIDDFGNGYAYRSDLQRMPLDFLKVDRSSLAASDDEDYRSWLLEAILHFGRDLSLTVISKGIETKEQLELIRTMGCTMAQGFLLGEPAPAEAAASLLAEATPTARTGSAGELTETP